MSPFEALYGRKCRTPLNWSETGDGKVFGSAALLDAKRRCTRSETTSKQPSLARKATMMGSTVKWISRLATTPTLKVTPLKGLKRFHVKGKLAPRFIGPCKVLGRRGNVAYQLGLPEHLSEVHDVFHISQLRKCVSPPHKQADYKEVELSPELTYEQKPVKIPEESERVPGKWLSGSFGYSGKSHRANEATWERDRFPTGENTAYLFNEQPKSRDEISNKGGRFVTTQDLVPKTFFGLFTKWPCLIYFGYSILHLNPSPNFQHWPMLKMDIWLLGLWFPMSH